MESAHILLEGSPAGQAQRCTDYSFHSTQLTTSLGYYTSQKWRRKDNDGKFIHHTTLLVPYLPELRSSVKE